ncbi:PREDICTED: subtilisin-like protease SBT1.4 [Ipomoea nil]|uniref:subtilisin-like protease SBT1.4 n=1 Tax=Ipomoea nil TaxID=35883 RepID=UPI000901CE21|nr:PREDICTED: subtilisin-like protease SBT1.4 [Ipomoea nil]
MIPTSFVTSIDGAIIRNYVLSASSPTARFEFRGTVIVTSPSAPRVAAFSGRGPNSVTPQILKPDVIAPGVNILAAWTGARGPSKNKADTRRTEFNIMSGTSMACPHVTGLAAMLRKMHPFWSPSAIKSAIMTTATSLDNTLRTFIDLSTGLTSVPNIYGSGHVDAVEMLDPGLVYDAGINDYLDFFCNIGYNSTTIAKFVGSSSPPVDCRRRQLGNPGTLNYPSFSVLFTNTLRTVTYKRTVTNVGQDKNTLYEVSWNISPATVNVVVNPRFLAFTNAVTVLSYQVTFTSLTPTPKGAFGSLLWSNGLHNVTSPIAVMWGTSLHSDL